MLKVLVGFEESQVVTKEFRNRGHIAFSCDLKDCSGGKPEWHIKKDFFEVVNSSIWDIVIAHPPCTDLSVSGSRYFEEKKRDGRQQEAINLFMRVVNCGAKKLCIENPVGIMSSNYRKPDQYIQPYEFGDDASKKTGLWLYGLSKLRPTKYIKPRIVISNGKEYKRWSNQTDSGQNKLPPSKERASIRSKTYLGIAKAMAKQWG